MACAPYCHCRLRPRLGDHSPTHACRLTDEAAEQFAAEADFAAAAAGLPVAEGNATSLLPLPTCPDDGAPAHIKVRARRLLQRLAGFLRTHLWVKPKEFFQKVSV
mmetsp:Transcript_10044/g.29740  ORF Transcript_10044/g.29740 Transcript_10044/m.29740 type:complete len:105 (+) Transcript_10044:4546-4860(+)